MSSYVDRSQILSFIPDSMKLQRIEFTQHPPMLSIHLFSITITSEISSATLEDKNIKPNPNVKEAKTSTNTFCVHVHIQVT